MTTSAYATDSIVIRGWRYLEPDVSTRVYSITYTSVRINDKSYRVDRPLQCTSTPLVLAARKHFLNYNVTIFSIQNLKYDAFSQPHLQVINFCSQALKIFLHPMTCNWFIYT